LSEGYNPGDICILGGRNKDCNIWAVHLTELGYKVVSSDSLLIHSNLRVKLSIAYLQLRLVPSGENEMKRFAELYFRAQNDSFNAYNQYVVELEMANGKRYRKFDSDAFLTDHFGSYNSFFFKHESLYDLIQSFYRLLGYDELSDPYLHHLADVIFEFGQKRGPDLKTFLDDYFATKDKIAVQIPESKDAVKVMTIHKSKGLEFPVVLIPSMDFDLSIKSTFLLESDDYILYKKPSKDDVLSILQEARAAEEAQVLTDKVNQCYVAMTRPIERLYINNSYQKSSFGRIFDDVLRLIEGVSDSDSQLLYETNDGLRSERSADEDIPLITPLRIQDNLWFPDISLQDRPELGDSNYLSEEMQFGVQFHLLMSRIDSPDAIESELSTAIDAGEVAVENRVSLKEKLTTLLNRKEYANLFSGHTKILSEQAIILTQSEIARPDKIIVKPEETILLDFKTGIPSAKDEKQINAYRETLESMGYPKVSSYLFYTATNELRLVGQDFFS
jgi:ATP-dependent exoDNAse (exonuclease V) beta subunit